MFSLNILNDVGRLQQQINRLFDESATSLRGNAPLLNMWRQDDQVLLRVELPGVDANQLNVSIHDDVVELKGVYPNQELKSDARWVRQERSQGAFARRIQLPYRVEADKSDAVYKNGVLTLTLPRAEAEKPKKIAVSAIS